MSLPSSTNALPANALSTNALFYGDNLYLLRTHIPTGSVDLIYSDPPFSSNRNYFVLFKDRTGKASAAQEEAFTDTWNWDEQSLAWYRELLHEQGNSDLAVTIEALRRVLKETPMMAYLVAMAIRLVEMHRVLKPTGSLYLHCDPTASHYLKIVLDVIFGPLNFCNHITWQRSDTHNDATKRFPAISDHLLLYRKASKQTFHKQYAPHASKTLVDWYQYVEGPDGSIRRMTKEEKATQIIPPGYRRFNTGDMASPNPRPNLMYDYKGHPHPTKGWRYSQEKMAELDAAGKLLFPENSGGRIMLKRYLDEQGGVVVGDVWTDISQIRAMMSERLGYPTQKPLALLERIINASSNPGDIVLDCFCGCGTAVDAAHKLGRRWIGMDVTAVAVDIIRTRMEQRHPEMLGKIPVIGFPRDLESAVRMFETDPYGFQEWACLRIGAHPRRHTSGAKSGQVKKGADSGIDGWMGFEDMDGSAHRAVVQVKGGKVQVSQIRDFCHVVEREQASLGFFLCLGDAPRPVTKPMQAEALKMGMWKSEGGHEYRRVQIITVAELLEGRAEPRYPPQDKRSVLGYKAGKSKKATGQIAADEMFEDV